MKLLVTNNTAVDIVFNHLGGYTLPGLASNIDFLTIDHGFTLDDIYKDDYLRVLYDSGDVSIWFENIYRIESYCSIGEHQQDPLSYDFKRELLNGYWLTDEPVIRKESGSDMGTLELDIFYRDYIDTNNKGDKVIICEQNYVFDETDSSLFNSQKQVLYRNETYKLYKLDGTVDEVKVKSKKKIYNTEDKRRAEGRRRRKNIENQLSEHVAMAGMLTENGQGGNVFSDINDAKNVLVDLQESHEDAFAAWINSGRGTIYDDIANNDTHSWLSITIDDNAGTQDMVPWMIGLTFKYYIVEKLKGNIK